MQISEERKKFLFDFAREAGLDLFFFQGLPWIKKKMGRQVTAEDREVVAEARKHVSEGNHAEARKVLVRHMMGWGMFDEQMMEEAMEAAQRSGLATQAQVASLATWLAADQRRRTRFRNALTIQDDAKARIRVIAAYAALNDAQRLARLTATGKLDDQLDEAIWNWAKTNIPGMTRQIWDHVCSISSEAWDAVTGHANVAGTHAAGAARATGRGVASAAQTAGQRIADGARAVGDTFVQTDAQLSAWGLGVQAAHPRPTRAQGRANNWWRWFASKIK